MVPDFVFNGAMIIHIYAFYALLACNLGVFAYALYAHARVRATDKALEQLDWETLVNLTGEVASIKRSMQKLSNRLNGMQSADPMQIMQELPVLQNATKTNGRLGG